jgi:hypothetical protein
MGRPEENRYQLGLEAHVRDGLPMTCAPRRPYSGATNLDTSQDDTHFLTGISLATPPIS